MYRIETRTGTYSEIHGHRVNDTAPWIPAPVPAFTSITEVRADVIRLLLDLGFGPYSNAVALVDDLDPRPGADPAEDFLTTDYGNQIRTVLAS